MEAHERVVQADLIRLIPSMVHHMDEPADPFGAGVYLVSGVAREAVKVALTGDGGDESFAGYDRFAGQRLLDYYCLLPEWFRRHDVQKLVERSPDSFAYNSAAQKARWLNELSLYGRDERYAHSMSFLRFTQDTKQKLFTAEAKSRIEDYDSTQKILTFFQSAECRRSGRPDALYGPDDPNAGPSAGHGRSNEHGPLSRSALASGGLQGRRVRRHDSRASN